MDFEAANWDVGKEAKELDRSLFQEIKKTKNRNSKKRHKEGVEIKLNSSTENKKRKLGNEGKDKICDTIEPKGSLKAVGVSAEVSSAQTIRKEKRNKKWQEKMLRRKLMSENNDTKSLTDTVAVSEKSREVKDDRINKNEQTEKNVEESAAALSQLKRSEKRKLKWETIQQKKRLKLEQGKQDTRKGSDAQSKMQNKAVGVNKVVSDKTASFGESVNTEGQLNRKERKKLLWKQKLKERKLSQRDNVENVNETGSTPSDIDKKHEKDNQARNENLADKNEGKQKNSPKKGKQEKKRKHSKNNENKSDKSGSLENVNKKSHSPTKKIETEEKSNEENSGTETNNGKKKTKRKRICKRNKFKGYVKPEPGTIKPVVEVTKDSTEKNIASPGKLDSSTMNASKNTDTSFSGELNALKDESVESRKGKKKRKRNNASTTDETNTPEVVKTNTVKEVPDKKGGKKDGRETAAKQKKKVSLDPNVLKAILSPGSGKKISSNDSVLAEGDKNEVADLGREKKGDTKGKTLLEKSRERLNAARFRYLNEQLYTTTGQEAFKMFQNDDVAFNVYHEGFQCQVEKWPTNPIDLIIEKIQSKPKHLILADFGCGDAKLARSIPNKVHSFDLVALNDHVTVCDVTKVPVKDATVDIAVFCLSLMGTNLTSYLQEANRVLKNNGTLMIAEVASRFHSVGSFVLKVEKMGFKIKQQDAENKMFVMMEFKKTANSKDRTVEEIDLKPCIYKKR